MGVMIELVVGDPRRPLSSMKAFNPNPFGLQIPTGLQNNKFDIGVQSVKVIAWCTNSA